MAILEAVFIALGTGVAKYLVKETLPQKWQQQVGAELLALGVKQLTADKETDAVAASIGKRLDTRYRRSTLVENEKNAALCAVIITLDQAHTHLDHLLDIDLSPTQLQKEMIGSRPQAMEHLSQDGEALYAQMLGDASQGIVQAAGTAADFLPNYRRRLLQGQSRLQAEMAGSAEMQAKLWLGIGRLLAKPEEKMVAFEAKYRQHLSDRLDKMEPFGIRLRDQTGQKLSLKVAFISLTLTASQLVSRLESVEVDDPAYRTLAVEPPLAMGDTATKGRVHVTDIVDNRAAHFRSQKIEKSIERFLPGQRRVMIEGGAGSGKSTLLQWLAVQAAQQKFSESLNAWNETVPFFIRFRRCKADGFPAPEQ